MALTEQEKRALRGPKATMALYLILHRRGLLKPAARK